MRNPLRRFNRLKVPKKLEKSLPFRLRPKYDKDLRTRKEKHLEAQNYVTTEEKKAQKFVSNLALIAANHNEREAEMKRKKRGRIAKKLSQRPGDDVDLQFEATR